MRSRLDRATALVLVVLSLAGCSGAKYQRPEPRYKMDSGGQLFGPKEQWQEKGEVAVAPYPEEKNLQSFAIPGPTENKFLIDTGSLNTDKDGVVRYAIIVRSSAGVDNASFEGIRCETREWRPYA
ncbi:MAG: CNP1-like family protein, partial [Burkholderiales bacterium]